jgi:alkaline phosphatase
MVVIRNPAAYAAAIRRRQEQEMLAQQMAAQQQAMTEQVQPMGGQDEPAYPQESDSPFGAYKNIWVDRQQPNQRPLATSMKKNIAWVSAFEDVFSKSGDQE